MCVFGGVGGGGECACVCMCVVYQVVPVAPPFGVGNDSDVWERAL